MPDHLHLVADNLTCLPKSPNKTSIKQVFDWSASCAALKSKLGNPLILSDKWLWTCSKQVMHIAQGGQTSRQSSLGDLGKEACRVSVQSSRGSNSPPTCTMLASSGRPVRRSKPASTSCSASTSLATCPLKFTPRLRYRVPAKCLERRAMRVTVRLRPNRDRERCCQKPWMRGMTQLLLCKACLKGLHHRYKSAASMQSSVGCPG